MPFVLNNKDQQAQGQGNNISGQSNSFGVNVPGQNASGGAKSGPQKSGQYQNIQKYIQANQPQAQDMAQKVSSGVESTIGKGLSSTGGLKNQVQQVGAYDPSKTLSNLGSSTDQEKEQYKTVKTTGGYSGPSDVTGIQGYQDAYKQSEAAKQAYNQVGNEQGQQELLKQTYARPNYSKGASTLDRSLVMGNDQARAQLENVSDKYKTLTSQLQTGFDQAGNQIASSKTQADANKALFNPAESQAKTAILSPIQQKAQAANEEAKKVQAAYEDASDLQLSPETMDLLGLTTGQQTFKTNLGSYFNPQQAEASVQNIASTDERQKYNQLLDFLGTNTGELGQGEATYKAPSFDKTKLSSDLSNQKREYDTVMSKPASSVVSVSNGSSDPGLGLPYAVQNAMNTMTLPELAKWVQSKPATGYGGDYGPDSFFGKQIMDQYNSINNQFGAGNVIQGPKDQQPIRSNSSGKLSGFIQGGKGVMK